MHIYRTRLVKILYPLASLKIYLGDFISNYLSFVLKISTKKEKCKKKMRKPLETTLNCTYLGGFQSRYFQFVNSRGHSLPHYGEQFGPSPGGFLPVRPSASIWFFRDPLTEAITIWYCSPASSLWNVCSEMCLGIV